MTAATEETRNALDLSETNQRVLFHRAREADPMRHDDEMSCQELVDVITGYIEGTLPEPDRVRLEAHLEECSHCRSYLEQMRETIAALGSLREQQLSPETRAGLLEAFRGWRKLSPG